LLDLVQIGEGLEDEDIAAAILERLELLAKSRARFIQTGRSQGLDPNAKRTHRSGDEQIILGDIARDFGGGAIDLRDLRHESVLRELDAIGAEAVGLENLSPCFSVRLVYVAHKIGCAQVELVVALVDEDTLVVEHRPHSA